jgi:hypothetical protein
MRFAVKGKVFNIECELEAFKPAILLELTTAFRELIARTVVARATSLHVPPVSIPNVNVIDPDAEVAVDRINATGVFVNRNTLPAVLTTLSKIVGTTLLNKHIDDVVGEVVEKLRDLERDDVLRENILPPLELVDGALHDRRLKKTLPLEVYGDDALATMLFKIVPVIVSTGRPVVALFEKPESVLTPVHQVVFAKYLERVMESARESAQPVYVVVTTDSPYIAAGFKNAKTYYLKFAEGRIVSEETAYTAVFSLATCLLL